MKLIEATPTRIRETGNGWCVMFGEIVEGQEIGVVYFFPDDPHYTRFRIIRGNSTPLYETILTRPLTPEEMQHFEALVKST
jgi:hypothetical protein